MRRDEILGALAALGADLAEHGLVADLYVVGGAAIALAYDERRATRDIDAVFAPKNEVYAAAARVAAALELPEGWLNDAVKGFLQGPDNFPTKIFDMPGLRCEVASAETVLVLKCLAHRLGEDDIVVLVASGKVGRVTVGDWPRREELDVTALPQPLAQLLTVAEYAEPGEVESDYTELLGVTTRLPSR